MSINQLELPYEEFIKNKKSISNTRIDHYIIMQKIGSGGVGEVYYGIDDKTKTPVAIKVIDLFAIEQTKSNEKTKEKKRRLARTESELMMKVDSPHIMKLHSVYQNKDLKIMIIEYCNGSSLSAELCKEGKKKEKEAIAIAKQIIFGLAEMHKKNIIHRDLKADNIMSHNKMYKIIDLGFARMIPQGEEVQGTVLGTIFTMAPEVMKKEKYGLKADVWGIGIILYEMVYGKLPFETRENVEDMYDEIMKKDIFPNNGRVNDIRPSNEMIELLKKLLTIDQKQRISWNELLDEKLFQDEEAISEEFRITVSISKLKKFLKNKDIEIEEIEFTDIINNTKDEGGDKNRNQYGIRQLSNSEIEQSNIDLEKQRDVDILKWAVKNHLECLKTELILNEIITVMETKNVVSLSDRKVIEFLYLLSSRCFFNMSFVLNDYNNEKNPIVEIFKSNVEFLYKKVAKKFEDYSEQLTCKESKITSIVKDKFTKILQNNKYSNKNKFLVGIENIEFLKEDQIRYTEENYIKYIYNMVVKDKRVKCMLINYRNIYSISENDVKTRKFHQIIDSMVKNYNCE